MWSIVAVVKSCMFVLKYFLQNIRVNVEVQYKTDTQQFWPWIKTNILNLHHYYLRKLLFLLVFWSDLINKSSIKLLRNLFSYRLE